MPPHPETAPASIIVRMPNWIGDAVLATPALRLLKASLPKSKIIALCRGGVSEAFVHNPLCDEIITLTSRIPRETIRALHRRQFEAGLLLTNSFSSALLFYLSGIPERAGYSTDGRRLLLTKPVRADKTFYKGHQADSYIELVKKTYKLPDNDIVREGLWVISEDEREEACRLLMQEGVGKDEPLIGINPGAAYGPAKRWPPECFGKLSDYCSRRYKSRIVIFGADADRNVVNKVKEAMKNSAPIDLCGKTSLRQLGALIRRCSLFVTNDSGPMHIAAALRVAVVAIFGSTNPEKTRPLSKNHIIVRKPTECSPCMKPSCPLGTYKCMRQITVDDLIEAIEKLSPFS